MVSLFNLFNSFVKLCWQGGKRLNKHGEWENVNLSSKEWARRWDKRHIGFHQANVHPSLVKHEKLLLKECSKVFLPLCGKSVDLIYLADKGHNVFGCEFVEQAIKGFFEENSLNYKKFKDTSGNFEVFKGIEKKVTVYRGDFFDISSEAIGKFDAIWDRGSLVAININKRKDYANIMQDLMTPHCKYLLNTFVFEGEDYYGPPHNVPNDDIQKLFGKFCNILVLDTERISSPPPKSRFLNMTNSLFSLKAKDI